MRLVCPKTVVVLKLSIVWADRSRWREHVDGVRLWETLHLSPASWTHIATALKSPMQCPLVLLVLHSVSITTTDRLTQIVLRTTRYKNTTRGQNVQRKFRSLRLVQGWDIVTGLLWLWLRNWKFLCKVFSCTPIEGLLLGARPRLVFRM